MTLTKEDVGKKFVREDGRVVTMLSHHMYESLFIIENGSVQLNNNLNGFSDDGTCMSLVSRHEPRSWLSDMPNLGDIKDGWIACDEDSANWDWFKDEPHQTIDAWSGGCYEELKAFSFPELVREQWRDSKISVAELKQWQAYNS